MHCGKFQPHAISRRDMLRHSACGFGAAAFAGMFAQVVRAAEVAGSVGAGASVAAGAAAAGAARITGPHFTPTARSV
ncbi:MAG: twin-arginine translocation signal domain-containing protein, partial [Proteobacteria bacterium]|nr:twin-arginine translocation signal domain-containing protein [Pseudomonadota bacterium]